MDSRTVGESRAVFKRSKDLDVERQAQHYDSWAESYEKDHSLMNYRSPHLAVTFLSEFFKGSPEDALVLDVACGTGWVAKLMSKLGFRHFIGVDGSKGMLAKAAETKLYQDLKLAILGPELLPALPDSCDVVIIAGALDAGFVPVHVVRELCVAARPGGLVCLCRGNHTGRAAQDYKEDLEKELQLMEDEGLWRRVGIKQVDDYMTNPHMCPEGDEEGAPYISGTVYMYEKCSNKV